MTRSPSHANVAGSGARARWRPRRLRDIDPTRHSLVLAWWGFTATFAFLRLLTWLIHARVAGLGDVSAGGVHLHHYVWGILLLIAVGIFGLVDRSPRTRGWMGLALGIGLALIVDEAALLIELRDVYWQDTGAISVGVAVLVIGIAGSVLVATRENRDAPPPAAPQREPPARSAESIGRSAGSSRRR